MIFIDCLYLKILFDCSAIIECLSLVFYLQRANTVRAFQKKQVWVLICTELMARGIDFKNVNLVINFDFPKNLSTYIHMVGRSGRAGQKGAAITFYNQEDSEFLRTYVSYSCFFILIYRLGHWEQHQKSDIQTYHIIY